MENMSIHKVLLGMANNTAMSFDLPPKVPNVVNVNLSTIGSVVSVAAVPAAVLVAPAQVPVPVRVVVVTAKMRKARHSRKP